MSHEFTPAVTDQRSDHVAGCAIYALRTLNGSAVKIGKTEQSFVHRRRQHEGNGPDSPSYPFVLAWRGLPSDETMLLRHFRTFRDPGRSREWFNAVPVVTRWLMWMARQHFTTDNECTDWQRLPYVGCEAWTPLDGSRTWDPPPRPLPDESAPTLFPQAEEGNEQAWWEHVRQPGIVTGDDFYSHAEVVASARRVLGSIDLDPASHWVANRVVKATRYFTVHENGLALPWKGRVWLNPPFGQWKVWGQKLAAELESGAVSEALALIALRSLSRQSGVNELLHKTQAICIPFRRLPFWGPKATLGPDDGHAILYFGTRIDVFATQFDWYGKTFSGMDPRGGDDHVIRRFYDHPGHPLHGKRMTKRESGLLEVICACGVEHPTPESITWMDEFGPLAARGTFGAHGCCGCCRF